jgi:hypothetical protein
MPSQSIYGHLAYILYNVSSPKHVAILWKKDAKNALPTQWKVYLGLNAEVTSDHLARPNHAAMLGEMSRLGQGIALSISVPSSS